MRFIPTRVHGMLDYAMGILLILAPWLFGFVAWGAETWGPHILGVATIGYSFFTAYELGLIRAIPMRTISPSTPLPAYSSPCRRGSLALPGSCSCRT